LGSRRCNGLRGRAGHFCGIRGRSGGIHQSFGRSRSLRHSICLARIPLVMQ